MQRHRSSTPAHVPCGFLPQPHSSFTNTLVPAAKAEGVSYADVYLSYCSVPIHPRLWLEWNKTRKYCFFLKRYAIMAYPTFWAFDSPASLVHHARNFSMEQFLSSGLVLIPNKPLASFVCLDSLDRFLAFGLIGQLVMEVWCYFWYESVASRSSLTYTFTSNLLTVFNFPIGG